MASPVSDGEDERNHWRGHSLWQNLGSWSWLALSGYQSGNSSRGIEPRLEGAGRSMSTAMSTGAPERARWPRLADSPRRPPAFAMGARGSYMVVDGDCAPSYLELWLDPLAA
jgi:hypothetical protein